MRLRSYCHTQRGLVYMTNPATGELECYRTTATPEEVQQHIDEVFSPAGYYDFEIKQKV